MCVLSQVVLTVDIKMGNLLRLGSGAVVLEGLFLDNKCCGAWSFALSVKVV